MLGQTHRRRQSARGPTGGPSESARMPPEPIRSGRGDAGFAWGGAGTLPRVVEGEVRENLPDDHGIVQRGEQAQPGLLLAPRGRNRHRELPAPLQHDQAARFTWIQTTAPEVFVPSFAAWPAALWPRGSAGHADKMANLKLTGPLSGG